MTVERTFERVERDLAEGELRRARDRLRSLAVSYPERLDVRSRLAEVYRLIGDAVQAGRWGYLRHPTTELEAAERAAFEHWVRRDRRHAPMRHAAELLRRPPLRTADEEALEILAQLDAVAATEPTGMEGCGCFLATGVAFLALVAAGALCGLVLVVRAVL